MTKEDLEQRIEIDRQAAVDAAARKRCETITAADAAYQKDLADAEAAGQKIRADAEAASQKAKADTEAARQKAEAARQKAKADAEAARQRAQGDAEWQLRVDNEGKRRGIMVSFRKDTNFKGPTDSPAAETTAEAATDTTAAAPAAIKAVKRSEMSAAERVRQHVHNNPGPFSSRGLLPILTQGPTDKITIKSIQNELHRLAQLGRLKGDPRPGNTPIDYRKVDPAAAPSPQPPEPPQPPGPEPEETMLNLFSDDDDDTVPAPGNGEEKKTHDTNGTITPGASAGQANPA